MFFAVIIILIVVLIIKNIRLNNVFTNIYSKLIGFIIGIKVKQLTSDEFKNISNKSVEKGFLIEKLVARPRWYPLLSVESEDGDNWKRLHKISIKRLRSISLTDAHSITKEECEELINGNNNLITSKELTGLVYKIFHRVTFNDYPTSESINIAYEASIEWKKAIAMKGTKNKAIVNKFMDMMKTKLNTDDIYEISAVAQPYIISPQINIPDILVEWQKDPNKDLEDILVSAHPFPILERFHKGTQYIFWMDKNCKDINWGIGKRKCMGMTLAKIILNEIFTNLKPHLNRINAKQNHRYSGRDNDNNLSLKESLYLGYNFIKILLMAICKRIHYK